MKKNLLAMLLAVVMIAAVVFIAAPATKAAEANIIVAEDATPIKLEANAIVDLNGLKDVVIDTNGFTVSLIDTKNVDDLTGNSAGTAKVTGTVADWVQHTGGFKYLALVNDDGTYSAHPFNISITEYGVNTHYSAISAKVTVIANDKVAKLIDAGEFGLHNYNLKDHEDPEKAAKEYSPYWKSFKDFTDEEGNYTTHGIHGYFYLEDSLTSDVLTANDSVKLGAYVKINGKIIDSLQILEVTPQAILTDLNNKADTYSIKQKVKMNAMMKLNTHLKTYCENFLPRDISTGVLTNEEKAVLSALTPADWNRLGNLQNVGPWAYGEANINVKDVLNLTAANMRKQLINASGRITGSNDYLSMLVDNSWGGSSVTKADSYTLTADKFEIGDIFCGIASVNGTSYWIALYQGNGKFLVMQSGGAGTDCFTVDGVDAIFSPNKNGFSTWTWYWVLRLQNLATAN